MDPSSWFQLGANCEAVFLLFQTNLDLCLQPNAKFVQAKCIVNASELKIKIRNGKWTNEEAQTWCEELRHLLIWYRALKAVERGGRDITANDWNFNPLSNFDREIDSDQTE